MAPSTPKTQRRRFDLRMRSLCRSLYNCSCKRDTIPSLNTIPPSSPSSSSRRDGNSQSHMIPSLNLNPPLTIRTSTTPSSPSRRDENSQSHMICFPSPNLNPLLTIRYSTTPSSPSRRDGNSQSHMIPSPNLNPPLTIRTSTTPSSPSRRDENSQSHMICPNLNAPVTTPTSTTPSSSSRRDGNSQSHMIPSPNLNRLPTIRYSTPPSSPSRRDENSQSHMICFPPPNLNALYLILCEFQTYFVEICIFDPEEGEVDGRPQRIARYDASPETVSLYPYTTVQIDACASFSTTIVDGKIFFLGGAKPSGFTYEFLATDLGFRSDVRQKCISTLSKVVYFDLYKHEWQRFPSMKTNRCRPSVLSQDGKIYVFGCSITPVEELRPFAEFIDLSKHGSDWESLLEVPPDISEEELEIPAETKSAFLGNKKEIMVILTQMDSMFTIPLVPDSSSSSPSLSLCHQHFSTRDNVVVVEKTAFVYTSYKDRAFLYACTLKEGQLPGLGESLDPDDEVSDPSEDWMGPERVKGSERISQKIKERFIDNRIDSPSYLFHRGGMRFRLVVRSRWDGLVHFVDFHILQKGKTLKDLEAVVDQYSLCRDDRLLFGALG